MRVFDASALGEIESRCSQPPAAFDLINQLIGQGDAVFCDEVIRELEWLYRDSFALTWAKAIKGERVHKGADYLRVEALAAAMPELIDETATEELCAIYVLAQAQELADDYEHDVCVVTEDSGDKPTRLSLGEACEAQNVCCESLEDFLSSMNRTDLLS